MLLTLDSNQMLQAWRRAAGLEPSFTSCSIEVFDGIDVDKRLSSMMRQWYLGLLDTASPDLIGPLSEASALLTLRHSPGDRHAAVTPDPSLRRLSSLRLSGWHRAAVIADARDIPALIAMQDNPFCAAGNCSPLAWRDRAGKIFAAPASETSTVVEAWAVVDPGDGTYILDERALETIPAYLKNFSF